MAGSCKIKLFKFIQQTYQDIGICPLKSNENHSPVNSKNWCILCCLALIFVPSTAYLLFEANSMIEYGMTFFIGATVLTCLIFYLIPLWKTKTIFNYIENSEQFIEKRVHSANIYKDATERIERFTTYFTYALFMTTILIFLPSLLYTLANYYILGSGKQSFFLFFPTWWPFDWKTPFGYLVAWLAQCTGLVAAVMTGTTFFGIVFGSCYLFIVITEDITNDVVAFNAAVKTPGNCDRAELIKHFHDMVQYYSDAKQCVNDFNQMIEYTLFAYFSWSILSMSSLLMTLQFQLWDDSSKLLEIMFLSISLFWLFVFNLIICEPGERVTIRFYQFGMEFCKCEWNKLPIEMQRMYLIFLSDTQQSKYIQSYAGIQCTRETFKQISTNGFSYFMTLRRFRA